VQREITRRGRCTVSIEWVGRRSSGLIRIPDDDQANKLRRSGSRKTSPLMHGRVVVLILNHAHPVKRSKLLSFMLPSSTVLSSSSRGKEKLGDDNDNIWTVGSPLLRRLNESAVYRYRISCKDKDRRCSRFADGLPSDLSRMRFCLIS
jgi:hypothetical protein